VTRGKKKAERRKRKAGKQESREAESTKQRSRKQEKAMTCDDRRAGF